MRSMAHVCPICGSEFWGPAYRITCSKECSSRRHAEVMRALRRKRAPVADIDREASRASAGWDAGSAGDDTDMVYGNSIEL